MAEKYVYFFGKKTEGNKDMKELLGGKGANLADMASLGIPVPPGFTIATSVCPLFEKSGNKLPASVEKEVDANITRLETEMGAKFGDPKQPLLVSVRSGAAVSMPGMMDTVLNLGMNDTVAKGMAEKTKNPRFVYDSYRRFLQMFGDVVLNVDHDNFEHALSELKAKKKAKFDTDLSADDLKQLVEEYKKIIQKETGKPFPQEPRQQLSLAIGAVFGSWNNERAITYRRLNNIAGLLGTAVNVQSMVYGNMGETSGTGVCFSRDPSTGENRFYGEYLMNAQGEDVVAGIRTPQPIATLEKQMPQCYKELVTIYKKLEQHYRDMQDMEFTIQEGKLYMLQTRNGKRTAAAAVRTAVEMVKEKLITKEEAILRVQPSQLDQLLHPRLDPKAKAKATVLAKGLPASPGAAVGKIMFDAHEAAEQVEAGNGPVVLVRAETSPEDLIGMNAAQGILTSRGGMTSHAAVVARGMGKPCVAGCSQALIDEKKKTLVVGGKTFKEGEYLTLDGATGEVFGGKMEVSEPELGGDFGTLLGWADEVRTLKIRANADTGNDAKVARDFGAQGIGLCRTEHMFFEGKRIKAMREMILSKTPEQRKKALDKVLPFQRQDFLSLYT
jgi:pyruvate,orthophosphate dikinase